MISISDDAYDARIVTSHMQDVRNIIDVTISALFSVPSTRGVEKIKRSLQWMRRKERENQKLEKENEVAE